MSTGLKIDSVEKTTYGIPITNSYATLPYGYAGPLGYKYNGTDIGLRFGPKGVGFNASGSHTLHENATKFLIMAVGGGGGGGGGSAHLFNVASGRSGNSGTGGRCVYAGYPVVSGQRAISFTIGGGGAGGSGGSTGNGYRGGAGGNTTVSYDGLTYVTATGGPGGGPGDQASMDPDNIFSYIYAQYSNYTQSASTTRTTGRFGYKDYAGTYESYTSIGPNVAANNSGFETAQLDTFRYINASSASYGYGGDGGSGAGKFAWDGSGFDGGNGSGGWVSIFEYFN